MTQSIPIFFAEHPDRELLAGGAVVGTLIAIVAVGVELQQVIEVELRSDASLRPEVRQRLAAVRELHASPFRSTDGFEGDLPVAQRQLPAP